MCTTGSMSEGAFFEGRNKYYEKDIGEHASKLIMKLVVKEKWLSIGKGFTGNENFFAPIRIFVPSIDPLVVVTIPWNYKTKINSSSVLNDLFKEGRDFNELHSKGSKHTYFMQHWATNIRIPIEIRSSLPATATQARVIADGFDLTTEIPSLGEENRSLSLGNQTLVFTRVPGKIELNFISH